MSPKVILLFEVLIFTIACFCKPLSSDETIRNPLVTEGTNSKEYFVKDLDGGSEEYIKYVVYGDEEARVKPKNCVGIVTLMALCF